LQFCEYIYYIKQGVTQPRGHALGTRTGHLPDLPCEKCHVFQAGSLRTQASPHETPAPWVSQTVLEPQWNLDLPFLLFSHGSSFSPSLCQPQGLCTCSPLFLEHVAYTLSSSQLFSNITFPSLSLQLTITSVTLLFFCLCFLQQSKGSCSLMYFLPLELEFSGKQDCDPGGTALTHGQQPTSW
jgi:hypothetical protein